MKIAVVAPARTLPNDAVAMLQRIAAEPAFAGIELFVHPQCFSSSGHFAGTDAERAKALISVGNDPTINTVWFARGGYGSCRIIDTVVGALGAAARAKQWLGYSDAGYLLSAFDRACIGKSVHSPMVADGLREGGEAAIRRVLNLFAGDTSGIDRGLGPASSAVALNASVLASLTSTEHFADLRGRVLIIEEVDEHLYAFDRALYTAFASGRLDKAQGVRLGRVSGIPQNDVPFAEAPRDIVERWCRWRGVPFLGHADIGHDADNKIVPFVSSSSHP